MADSTPDPAAPAYALLAELLSREVDANLLELLRVPGVREIFLDAEPSMGSLLDGSWDASVEEAHAIEFCRLFIQPCVCLPLAGRWAEGVADEQLSIARWFADGVSPALAPHLAELSDSNIAKILAVRSGLAGAPPEAIATYEAEMVHPWAASFAGHLAASAELPLYRATAKILSSVAGSAPAP